MIATYTRLGDRGLALTLALALAGLPASTAAAAPPPAGSHDAGKTSPAGNPHATEKTSTSPTSAAPTAGHHVTSEHAEPEPTAGHDITSEHAEPEPTAEPGHGDGAGPSSTAPEPAARNPSAEAAYAEAVELMKQGKLPQAIGKADLAAELEPTWSEPVRLRAEAFAALTERYEPSAAFTSAHAAELERLLVLEPGIDVEARQRQVSALRQQGLEAHEIEQRRRRLNVPAFMVIIAATGLFVSGAMLYSMKPRETLVSTAYREERRDRAGIVLMTAGGVLIPPAIVLGVLSARQTRRDAAVRDLEIETGRARARLRIGPQFVRGGGGAGLTLRF
jgi:hypothetical protein